MNDELDITESTGRMFNDPVVKDQPEIPFCGCLSVRYYQPFFDVDTSDVMTRIGSALFYCNREQTFLSLVGEKPDAYGPFWISTTLVFTVAVTSHISSWFSSWMKGNNWEYNFQSVLTASSLIYGYAAIAPTLIWFVFRQYEPKLKFISIFCLYGYSLIPFLPAVMVCLFPFELGCWLAMLTAAIVSGLLLLKNLAPLIVVHAKNQAALLLAFVGFIQLTLMISMKLYFFYDLER
mmetsp:Transcript_20481/g.28192  ORF Transcript_20481/g.28192 Transcript_20481/m.28192 type:complete len:235 (-) Transcript_20481:113-817(-)